MQVNCPNCGTPSNLPDRKIKKGRAKVKCGQCAEVFFVDQTGVAADGAILPPRGDRETPAKPGPPIPKSEEAFRSGPAVRTAARVGHGVGEVRRARVSLVMAGIIWGLTVLILGGWALAEHFRYAAARDEVGIAQKKVDLIERTRIKLAENHQKELQEYQERLDQADLEIEDLKKTDSFLLYSAKGFRAQKDYQASNKMLRELKLRFPGSPLAQDADDMIRENLMDLGELDSNAPRPQRTSTRPKPQPRAEPRTEVAKDPALDQFQVLYEELMAFKDDPEFHKNGFDGSGPYHEWMEKIQSFRDSPQGQKAAKYGISAGHLMKLGQRYQKQKGQESRYTEMVNPMIRKTLGMD